MPSDAVEQPHGAVGERMRITRSRTRTSTNDTVTKTPNTTSAQAPTDIGDQYLKIGALVARAWCSTSMCQKRSGWPRSRVSRTGQGSSVAKAT